MFSTSCWRGWKLRTGNGPNPSAETRGGPAYENTTRLANAIRHHDRRRPRTDGSMSVWEIEAGKDRASLFAEPVVDPTDYIGSNDPSESYTGSHTIVFKADVLETAEDLSGVQERRDLEIGRDACHLRPGQMNAFFNAHRDQMLVDKAVDPVASEIVLPS